MTHTQIINSDIQYLAGNTDNLISCIPMHPYSDIVCDFLNKLSKELINDSLAKQFPDVITFAFWCRNSNIVKLRKLFDNNQKRLGRGRVFHIAPSNVPINFAFSYVFSLLAGNSNIVRVPSKEFPQVTIVCNIIDRILSDTKYTTIREQSTFIRYKKNDEITKYYSENCNVRIIWGGDNTIFNVRKIPIPPRSTEVVFADRYSFSVIGCKSVLKSTDYELSKLVESFYNDTYLMDQNACSSPHLVIWIGTEEQLKEAKERFWKKLHDFVISKYILNPISAVDKFTHMCQDAIDQDNISYYKNYDNYILLIGLNKLSSNIEKMRGKCGYFYEYGTHELDNIAHIITDSYQTLTYFGIEKSTLENFVMKNFLRGIDRIVPIGSSLDISIIWDGYDLISTLSRIIDIK